MIVTKQRPSPPQPQPSNSFDPRLVVLTQHLLTNFFSFQGSVPKNNVYYPIFETPHPSLGIPAFIKRIHQFAYCSKTALITALFYLKIMSRDRDYKLMMNAQTVHKLYLAAVVVAIKFVDDTKFNNSYYAEVGGITTQELRAVEEAFLQIFNWNVFVDPSDYEKFLQNPLS